MRAAYWQASIETEIDLYSTFSPLLYEPYKRCQAAYTLTKSLCVHVCMVAISCVDRRTDGHTHTHGRTHTHTDTCIQCTVTGTRMYIYIYIIHTFTRMIKIFQWDEMLRCGFVVSWSCRQAASGGFAVLSVSFVGMGTAILSAWISQAMSPAFGTSSASCIFNAIF